MLTGGLPRRVLGEIGWPVEEELAERLLQRGIQAFVASSTPTSLLDALIGTLDRLLAAQLDALYAQPALQALEARWRGLRLLVDRIDPQENVRVEVLNVSAEDLQLDFEDAPEVRKSGLYKTVYSAEYGPFGGRPFAAVIASFTIEASQLRLLRACGEVASLAALLFVAEAGDSLIAQPDRVALERARPEHGGVVLVHGRIAARTRWRLHAKDGRPFTYRERDVVPALVPGGIALAITMARSFAACRLPSCAWGPGFGWIRAISAREDEPASLSPGDAAALGLTRVEDSGNGDACVLDARPFGKRASGEVDLAALLLAQRVVHHLKVMQREQIGTWKSREALGAELAAWLSGYVAEAREDAPPVPSVNLRTEAELAATLARDPSDEEARLVYADWLEREGRVVEAFLLRGAGGTLPAATPLVGTRRALGAVSLRVDEGDAAAFSVALEVTPFGGRTSLALSTGLDKE